MKLTFDRKQWLYVCQYDNGSVACIGFAVAERQRKAVLQWLGRPVPPLRLGTHAHYEAYDAAIHLGLAHALNTGEKCPAELTPELIGLEGRRVEIVTFYGEQRRFQVGKSTGWLPVHLELARHDSSDGGAVTGAPFRSLRVIR